MRILHPKGWDELSNFCGHQLIELADRGEPNHEVETTLAACIVNKCTAEDEKLLPLLENIGVRQTLRMLYAAGYLAAIDGDALTAKIRELEKKHGTVETPQESKT